MAAMTPPPFENHPFDSLDALISAVQAHCKAEGWAIVKARASNRRANGQYYKYDLVCDRGRQRHNPIGTGRRNVSTRKEGCPFVAQAAAKKNEGDRWFLSTINSAHNHPPSLDPSVHPMHRRLAEEERQAIQQHTKAGSRLHVMAAHIRQQHPEVKKKDIVNERAKIERIAAGPYTQTQRFLQALEKAETFHRVCRRPDNRIIGVFWTFSWCREMTKKYPDVICMDNTYNVYLPFSPLLLFANIIYRSIVSNYPSFKLPE